MKKILLILISLLLPFFMVIKANAFTKTNIVEISKIGQSNPSSFPTDLYNASLYIISLYKKVFYGLDTTTSPAIQLFLKNSNGQIIFIGTLSEGFFKRYLIKPGRYELIAVVPSEVKNVEPQISTYPLSLEAKENYFFAEQVSDNDINTFKLEPNVGMFYIEHIREKEHYDLPFQDITFNYPFKISNMERAEYTNPKHATDIHDFGYVSCKLTPKQQRPIDISSAYYQIKKLKKPSETIDKCIYPFLGFSYGMFGPAFNFNPINSLLDNQCPAFADFEYYFECKFSKWGK